MPWVNWRGPEVIRLLNNSAVKAVQTTAETIRGAAIQEVPHDEGTLEKTGTIIMAAGNIPACVICFGGGSGTGFPIVPYAIRWHEKTANFQRGRKRFYLRDPFNRLAKATLEAALQQEMGRFM